MRKEKGGLDGMGRLLIRGGEEDNDGMLAAVLPCLQLRACFPRDCLIIVELKQEPRDDPAG